ncbi:MAG: VacJ family lipoprotein [Vibrio sp.]
MIKKTQCTAAALLLSALLCGCSSTPDDGEVESTTSNPGISDPFEGFNRVMWDFNYDVLDPYLLRPTAVAYMEWTPEPIRDGINNFLANLDEPASAINNLLMGNGTLAVQNFSRFLINSTIGILGLFDVASAADIPKNTREFGDVIGHWGVGDGTYLMIPGYGPLSPRETTDLVDTLYLPLNLLTFWQSAGKWAVQGLETRYELIDQEGLLENSPDTYSLSKSIYVQHQDYKAMINQDQDEVIDDELLDEYLDDDSTLDATDSDSATESKDESTEAIETKAAEAKEEATAK